ERKSRRRVFSCDKERSVDGKPPHARGAVQGTRDRPPRGHPRLRRRRCADLPGQDRQDAVPGPARGARCVAEALVTTWGKPCFPHEPPSCWHEKALAL